MILKANPISNFHSHEIANLLKTGEMSKPTNFVGLNRETGEVYYNKDRKGIITFADKTLENDILAYLHENGTLPEDQDYITFDDAKEITSLGGIFVESNKYKSFNEFQYFYNIDLTETFAAHDGTFDVYKPLFYGCEMDEITFPATISNVGYETLRNTKIKKINLPYTTETFDSNSFNNAELGELCGVGGFPLLKSIDRNAFYGAKIKKLDLSNATNVNTFGKSGYFLVEDIRFPKSTEPLTDRITINYDSAGNRHNATYIDTGSLTSLDSLLPTETLVVGKYLKDFGGEYKYDKEKEKYQTIKNIIVDEENDNFTDLGGKNVLVRKGDKSLIAASIDVNEIPEGVEILGKTSLINQISDKTEIDFKDVKEIKEESIGANNNLTSVTLNNCEIIPDKIFANGKLTSLNLPKIKSIGKEAFNGNPLTSVTLGDSVKTIYSGAFYGSKLKKVVLPNDCEYKMKLDYQYSDDDYEYKFIEKNDYYFYGNNTNLETLEIGSGVTIPNSTYELELYDDSIIRHNPIGLFDKATTQSIKNIIYKEGNTKTIDLVCPADLTAVTSVTLPSSLKEISDKSLSGLTSLESIEIPTGVTKIGICGLYNALSLKSIELPSSLTTIERFGLSYLKSVESIVIPNSVTSYGEKQTFCNNISMTSLTLSNNASILPKGMCYGCSALTGVIIPSSVEKIGTQAFDACSSIKSIRIPNTVKKIEYKAFRNCSSLAEVTFEEGFKGEVDFNAFINCDPSLYEDGVLYLNNKIIGYQTDATNIVIKEGVTELPDGIFYGSKTLTSITLPESLKSIGYRSFYNCTNLVSVNIPSNLESIGDEAFEYCSSLNESIVFPSTLKKIPYCAFLGCKLTDVTFNADDLFVSSKAFAYCDTITSVTFNGTVENLGLNAFRQVNAPSLKEITFNKGAKAMDSKENETSDGSVFWGCTTLEKVTFNSLEAPKQVTDNVSSWGSTTDANYCGYNNRAKGTNMFYVPSNATYTEAELDTFKGKLFDTSAGGFTLSKTLPAIEEGVSE